MQQSPSGRCVAAPRQATAPPPPLLRPRRAPRSRPQTPVTYLGPSRKPDKLAGPECKVERKYGTEASFTVFGGPADGPIRFASEAEFFAALVGPRPRLCFRDRAPQGGQPSRPAIGSRRRPPSAVRSRHPPQKTCPPSLAP
jgi:hypothetical protein